MSHPNPHAKPTAATAASASSSSPSSAPRPQDDVPRYLRLVRQKQALQTQFREQMKPLRTEIKTLQPRVLGWLQQHPDHEFDISDGQGGLEGCVRLTGNPVGLTADLLETLHKRFFTEIFPKILRGLPRDTPLNPQHLEQMARICTAFIWQERPRNPEVRVGKGRKRKRMVL